MLRVSNVLHRMMDFTDSDLVAIRNSPYQPDERKLLAEAEQYRRESELAEITAMVLADRGTFQYK
jgi:hypothetical protein